MKLIHLGRDGITTASSAGGRKEDDDDNDNDGNVVVDGEDEPSLAELGSVAVVSGLVGALILGPLVGVGVAVGAACVALTDTPPGKVTRQAGTSLVQAQQHIQEYESKHQILQKSRDGMVHGCGVVSEKFHACGGKGNQTVP